METPNEYSYYCVGDEYPVLFTLRSQLSQHFPNYTIEIVESAARALLEQANQKLAKLDADLEYQLEERTQQLKCKAAEIASDESEEQLRQIVDNIDDIFFLRCRDTQKLLYVNLAYEQIFQQSREVAYQNSQAWINAVHLEDRDRILTKFQRELQGNEFFNDEFRIMLPDGSIRWVLDRSFPIYNKAGEIYRHAGVTSDITAQKLAELALQQNEAQFQTFSPIN